MIRTKKEKVDSTCMHIARILNKKVILHEYRGRYKLFISDREITRWMSLRDMDYWTRGYFTGIGTGMTFKELSNLGL